MSTRQESLLTKHIHSVKWMLLRSKKKNQLWFENVGSISKSSFSSQYSTSNLVIQKVLFFTNSKNPGTFRKKRRKNSMYRYKYKGSIAVMAQWKNYFNNNTLKHNQVFYFVFQEQLKDRGRSKLARK